jgi:hypothetical protein
MDANQTIFSCPFVVRESSRRNKVLIGRNAEIAEKVALDPDTGPDGPHLFNVRARQTGISLFKNLSSQPFLGLTLLVQAEDYQVPKQ